MNLILILILKFEISNFYKIKGKEKALHTECSVAVLTKRKIHLLKKI